MEAEKSADAFGLAFAEKHRHDELHYFIGAGNQWEPYILMRCAIGKSKAGYVRNQFTPQKFLHGTLEIVDETTPVTLFWEKTNNVRLQNESLIYCQKFVPIIQL